MAKIHRVVPGIETDVTWLFLADDERGQIRTGETIASVESVRAYDSEGEEVEGVFAEAPAPSAGDATTHAGLSAIPVTARVSLSAETFATDLTLYVEVIVTTDTGRQAMYLDARGERPRLWINARP